MERVVEIVMPWLNAENVGRLGCTCRFLAEAARAVAKRRIEDATQGWESIAVPVENQVDGCAYPDFWYTPFVWVASSGQKRWGPWGGLPGKMLEARRGLSESEFSGALLVGTALNHAGIGCKCHDGCSIEFPDSQTECPPSKDDAPDISDETCIELNGFQEYRGAEVPYFEGDRWQTQKDLDSLHPSKRSRKHKHKEVRIESCACPCGRVLGGNLAYGSTFRSLVQKPVSKERSDIFEHAFPEMGREEGSDESTDYVNQQRETTLAGIQDHPLVMECGLRCSCSTRCRYRMSQSGLAVRAKVVRTKFKGWSLQALQDVKQGCFVCEYAGELITTEEAKKRLEDYDRLRRRGFGLLILREYLPSGRASVRVNIDATKIGNVARFINHSCDGGNLMRCLIRIAGSIIPKLAFFARRDIVVGEEFTFSYGEGSQDKRNARHQCFCGTPACLGWLPFEPT